jgi:hypothetical protein
MQHILVGQKYLFYLECINEIGNKGVYFHFDFYKRVSVIQISWLKKGGNIKTKITLSKKFKFETKINGVVYHSDKISSVLRLVKNI